MLHDFGLESKRKFQQKSCKSQEILITYSYFTIDTTNKSSGWGSYSLDLQISGDIGSGENTPSGFVGNQLIQTSDL